MDYKVELRESSHWVIGLKSAGEVNTLLIYRHQEGDVDTRMSSAEMMHCALYDLFQTHCGLKSGDSFDTEFGKFVCDGVHVVSAKDFVLQLTMPFVLETVLAMGDDGVPAGHLYAAILEYIDLDTFMGIVGALVDQGLITNDHHLLKATAKTREAAQAKA